MGARDGQSGDVMVHATVLVEIYWQIPGNLGIPCHFLPAILHLRVRPTQANTDIMVTGMLTKNAHICASYLLCMTNHLNMKGRVWAEKL